jgi:8-oxo-dGTP diphosphatase
METFESCGKKEVRRETGLDVEEIEFLSATNNLSQGEKRSTHSVSIFMIAKYIAGEPTIADPEKCLAWKWFARSDLPKDMSVWMKQMVGKVAKPRFLS